MQSGQFAEGRYIALSGNEEIVLGAQYEFRGSIPWEIVAALPDSWVESAIAEIFSFQHAELDVLGVEVNSDGSVRIRVVAKHNSPVIILAGVILIGLAILAGMKIEQMYQVVFGTPGNPPAALTSLSMLVTVAGIGFAAWWLWTSAKKAGS